MRLGQQNQGNFKKSSLTPYHIVLGENNICIPLQKLIFVDYLKFQR